MKRRMGWMDEQKGKVDFRMDLRMRWRNAQINRGAGRRMNRWMEKT